MPVNILVTAATNASPIVVTTDITHGLSTGNVVLIKDVVGNTAANGFWKITVIDTSTLSLNSSTGNGAYVSGGSVANYPTNITDATNATPIVVTTAGEHGFTTGDKVLVSSVGGNTVANGIWTITVTGVTTFSLDDSVGVAAYTSGGLVVRNSSVVISDATNASPIVITTSAPHNLTTGDNVLIASVGGNTDANGYWSVTVLTATTFSLDYSVGNAAYTSGGTVELRPAQIEIDGDGFLVDPEVTTTTILSLPLNVPNHGITTSMLSSLSIQFDNSDTEQSWTINTISIIDKDTLSVDGALDSDFAFDSFTLIWATPTTPNEPGDPPPTDAPEETYIDSPGIDNELGETVPLVRPQKFQITASLANYDGIPMGTTTMSDGGSYYYKIDAGGGVFECGVGVYSATANKLLRSKVTDSSATEDAAINFNSGSKTVDIEPIFVTVPNPAVVPTVVLDVNGMALNVLTLAQSVPMNLLDRDRMLNSNARWELVYRKILGLSPRALLIRNADGTGHMYSGFGFTDAELIALRTAAIAEGKQTITGAEALEVARQMAAQAAPTRAELEMIGCADRPRVPRSVSANPYRSRWAAGLRVAGAFANVTATVGMIALDIVQSLPLNLKYRQGRLQIRDNIATTDAERCGFGTKITYVPIDSDSPTDSQITLAHGYSTTTPEFVPYRIVSSDNIFPSVDVSQPSPIPFTYDSEALPAQAAAVDGYPFDIFMCAPVEEPTNATGVDVQQVYHRLNPNGTDRLVVSDRRRNECPVPRNTNQLPKLFYLNWAGKYARRVSGVGHQLVFHPYLGMCLLGLKTTDYDITDMINGTTGYMTTAAQAKTWKYVYLGTGMTIGGNVIMSENTKMLYNYTNGLTYDSWQTETTAAWALPRTASNGYNAYIKPGSGVWNFHYLDPRDQYSAIPFTQPSNGTCRVRMCGPIGYKIVNDSGYISAYTLKYPANEANDCIGGPGFASCDDSVSEMTGIRVPTGTQISPGWNKIRVNATLGNFDPWEFNWHFIGTLHHYYYNLNFGYNAPSNPRFDRDVDQSILHRTAEATLRRSRQALDNSQIGFGMTGTC